MIRDYVNKFKKSDEPFEILIRNETFFREKFTQFLYSPRGGIFQVFVWFQICIFVITTLFQPNFWFSEPLKCGEPAPDVLLQAISYSHRRFTRSGEWVPAMRKVQQVAKVISFICNKN